MKRFCLLLGLILSVSAFGAEFHAADLEDHTLLLRDTAKIETYRFAENGVVLVQIGAKDHAVAGPASQWEIAEGFLVIRQDKKVVEKFELIDRKDDTLRLRRKSGEVVEFELEAQ